MEYFPAPLEKLVEQFARLPGIGSKSAQRLAFHVLNLPMEQAQEFANAIVEANGIRQSAVQYTDDMLKSLQNILNHTLETAQAPFNSFLSAVRSSYDIVTSNRGELASGIIEPADEQTTEE